MTVIPAKAGIQAPDERAVDIWMCLDSRLRGNDDSGQSFRNEVVANCDHLLFLRSGRSFNF